MNYWKRNWVMILAFSAFCLWPQIAEATSLYSPVHSSLYSSRKASRVGDLVTVHIVESAQGTNKTTLRSSKTQELSFTGSPWEEILDFIPLYGGGMEFENKQDGQGNNTITGDLRAKVTAQVVQVLPNGNLVLEATRQIELNGEVDHLTLRGVVRQEDIQADNIVLSTYLADAQISYKGKGAGRQTAHSGIFTRILNWIF